MIIETSNTWLLHKRASGDASVRIRLFTRDFGLIDALYKGGRTPKKQVMLQPFTPLWVALDNRRDYYFVRQLEMESTSQHFIGHVLFAAHYVNEIVNAMLKPQDAEPLLYDAYQDTLQALSAGISIEPVLREFEQVLLNTTGYGLDLTQDASAQMIDAMANYQFIAGTGFVRTHQGFSGEDILAFAAGDYQNETIRRTAKQILRQAIKHALGGRPIESRSLFQS